MTTPLRVLIVEDSEDDALLLQRELSQGGFKLTQAQRVDTPGAMAVALRTQHWDVVISDFSMPSFSALGAIQTLHESELDIPIIIVSGTVGELVAVETMRAGAHDYLMKDNLMRLCEAIKRELREANMRAAHLKSQQSLYDMRERALVTLNSIGDAVITTDSNGMIDYMNPVAERVTGWRSDEATGMPMLEVFKIINEVTQEPLSCPAQICLSGGCVVELAGGTQLISRDGQHFEIEDTAAPIRNAQGKIIGSVIVFHDVSKERSMASLLDWQSSHDALTGLINRCEFERRMAELLRQANAERSQHCLLYIDLDQFKVINDTCGHVAGDELLKQLTFRLKTGIRAEDSLARLGGDEFGILLASTGINEGHRLAEKFMQTLHDLRFEWEGANFEVAASIGLAMITQDSESAGNVLSAADVACYMAKDTGRNRIHVYQEGDTDLARRHGEMQWVSRINQALEEQRFILYSQAIVPLSNNGHKPHKELLIRLRSREGQLISPASFIPAAERYNLMPTLDRWVINTAFTHLASVGHGNTNGQPNVTINLSGTSLNDTAFLGYIQDQLEIHSIRPSDICFEITETAAIASLGMASRFIRTLKRAGCRFALDDFGSGLSSFAYLKNLPVDYLKIDGNFVKDMLNDPMDHAIVESIHQIGKIMGMQTIAEFVETQEIMQRLKEIGVDYGQGYGIEKPKPLT